MTDHPDIVERLAIQRAMFSHVWQASDALDEAAAEITRLRAEAEALRKDAERWRYINTQNNIWRRDDGAEPPYSMLCVVLPYGADLSCRATRENAIDAAIAATKEQQA